MSKQLKVIQKAWVSLSKQLYVKKHLICRIAIVNFVIKLWTTWYF